jgi:hypothetical protein
MLDASHSVARFIAGRTREDLEADEMLRFALVRAIEIIGEPPVRYRRKGGSACRRFPGGRLSEYAIAWSTRISISTWMCSGKRLRRPSRP